MEVKGGGREKLKARGYPGPMSSYCHMIDVSMFSTLERVDGRSRDI